ncbi:hypothetical protein AKJ57_04240 [candidate division MSBL1 archaeon SCGC-AAA259A05]|uniref:Uncharacterized protein n=1 Tax=candidate division MSBL1 archaeon SCGC-AAA259A05 TaxID=1698259 RepID=A0A133U7Y2_9EURY|nr:hypothetical protein AKJ57_04240 [candidate division MSBL1 archaeon SCGC-AAA259A05]
MTENEDINLIYLENGIYRGKYVLNSNGVGRRIVEIKAVDPYGNSGTREYVLQVRSPLPEGLASP